MPSLYVWALYSSRLTLTRCGWGGLAREAVQEKALIVADKATNADGRKRSDEARRYMDNAITNAASGRRGKDASWRWAQCGRCGKGFLV